MFWVRNKVIELYFTGSLCNYVETRLKDIEGKCRDQLGISCNNLSERPATQTKVETMV